ncbi:MAG: NAD(P)H-dependent oxidoreductase, partial [Devosiaceae bacterium]|nr:NAD(P)H-dependent oxidoreductase [Devosiaceae bacterium]
MKKRILLLNGHPVAKSFIEQICVSYQVGAKEAGHDLRIMNVAEMDFDIDLDTGHRAKKALEPGLIEFQNNLGWCDHFVLAHPLWWGSVPAKTKGVIDRAMLPGFAFSFEEGASTPVRLMKGKSAQVIITSDISNWFDKFLYRFIG